MMLSRFTSSLARTATRAFSAATIGHRGFSGVAVGKLQNIIKAEIQMEKDQYEQIETIKNFLKENSEWKLTESEGDVNMKLVRQLGDKQVVIEWQLVSPFGADFDMPEESNQESEEVPMDSTDFTVTVQDKSGHRGITFFCQTTAGEGHRYMIGNVRSFMSENERDSPSAYNGPDFEDLDEGISEELGNWLSSVGITDEICDFIDASAIDKEQREYMRWLENVQSFIQA
jgi:complement component 1 Q subcomponent-binding protein